MSLSVVSSIGLYPPAIGPLQRRGDGGRQRSVVYGQHLSYPRTQRLPSRLRRGGRNSAVVVSASAAVPVVKRAEPPEEASSSADEIEKNENKITKSAVDNFLSSLLWSARHFVLAAVAGSLVMSALMFFQGTVGVWHCAVAVAKATAAGTITLENPDVALICVEILDKFLAGIVTYIFGTGVFELFIHKMKDDGDGDKPQWLHVNGIHDMEMALGKVVITILVVNLLAAAKKVAVTQAHHLVFIAGAVLLSACALSILHWVDGHTGH